MATLTKAESPIKTPVPAASAPKLPTPKISADYDTDHGIDDIPHPNSVRDGHFSNPKKYIFHFLLKYKNVQP